MPKGLEQDDVEKINLLLRGKPLIFSCQECLLNRIEIGQFMQMKYKVGRANIRPAVVAKGKPLIPLLVKSMYGIYMKTLKAKLIRKIVWNLTGKLSDKFLPLLVKNTLFPKYATSLNEEIRYGIMVAERINRASPTRPILTVCTKISVNNILETVPRENIRFQKLSLFKRALIQFIILLLKPLIAFIIPCLKVWSKRVFQFLVIIISCCSYSFHAQADTEEIISLIKAAEAKYQIPEGLLHSIAKVESEFAPYALNIEGKPLVLKSLEEAKTKITSLVQSGVTSFDIGIMQLNYRWHGDQFADPEEMLLPKKNIEYAARLLKSLYKQHKDWHTAVRYYHSATPMHHKKYSRKVIMAWIGG